MMRNLKNFVNFFRTKQGKCRSRPTLRFAASRNASAKLLSAVSSPSTARGVVKGDMADNCLDAAAWRGGGCVLAVGGVGHVVQALFSC